MTDARDPLRVVASTTPDGRVLARYAAMVFGGDLIAVSTRALTDKERTHAEIVRAWMRPDVTVVCAHHEGKQPITLRRSLGYGCLGPRLRRDCGTAARSLVESVDLVLEVAATEWGGPWIDHAAHVRAVMGLTPAPAEAG